MIISFSWGLRRKSVTSVISSPCAGVTLPGEGTGAPEISPVELPLTESEKGGGVQKARNTIDRLTIQERAIIRARLEHPTAPQGALANYAKIKGSKRGRIQTIQETLRRPRVLVALRTVPPTLDAALPNFFALSAAERTQWI